MADFSQAIRKVLRHEGVVPSETQIFTALNTAMFRESAVSTPALSGRGRFRDYPCSIDGCDRQAYAKRLCNAHYLRLRNGTPAYLPIRNRRTEDQSCACGTRLNGKGGWGRCGRCYRTARSRLIKRVLINLFGATCLDCHERQPACVFDFHHTSDKAGSIGNLVYTGSLKRIAREAVKCVLICANCHRVRHAEHRSVSSDKSV